LGLGGTGQGQQGSGGDQLFEHGRFFLERVVEHGLNSSMIHAWRQTASRAATAPQEGAAHRSGASS